MQVKGGELQSALQYQVLSTGLQHGQLLVVVGGVQNQWWHILLLEKHVSDAYRYTYIRPCNCHHSIATTTTATNVQCGVFPCSH